MKLKRSVQISMTNQFTHIADVKVGKVKGNSRMYPQLACRVSTRKAGKKASIYEIRGHVGDPAFIISFDDQNRGAAHHGDTHPEGCVANGCEVPVKPSRNSTA